MSKKLRHQKILELIESTPIETQGQLTKYLVEAGFDVTQATVSRDIKELRLIKITDYADRYRYAVPRADNAADVRSRLVAVLRQAAITIQSARNMVVIKTIPGSAQACAMAIETLNFEEVVGALAGDDTVFIITPDDESGKKLEMKIEEVVN